MSLPSAVRRPPSIQEAYSVSLAALLAFMPLIARAQSLPRVHVLATGGTISNLGGDARRTGAELIQGIPGLPTIARVTVEQFSNVASGAITQEMWRDLAKRIIALQGGPDAPAGYVITHGTDTMEETAYFLSLTTGGCAPVLVTGAMRQANAVGPDGPANLFNAIRVAASPAARGRGTMVLMNDEIFSARDVTKSNTTRLNAFSAPDAGVLGLADPDTVVFHRVAPDVGTTCRRATFDVTASSAQPRVDVVYAHIGADSVFIDAAVAAGAKGLVMAGVGRGGSTPSQGRALRRARDAGVVIATSNRTGSGRVGAGFANDSLQKLPAGAGATIGSAELNPQKARILLGLALAARYRPADIARLFEVR
ncbi:MAG: asparaginase [Gemmatimonadaceae bacterium]